MNHARFIQIVAFAALGSVSVAPRATLQAQTATQDTVLRRPGYDLYAPLSELSWAAAQLDSAVVTYGRSFGALPQRVAIVLFDGRSVPPRPSGEFRVRTWFTAAGLRAAREHGMARPGAVDTTTDRLMSEAGLPHEACHWFLAGRLDQPNDDTDRKLGQNHQDAGRIPAWLNEGFATLCEPAALQGRRRIAIAEPGSAAIPLQEFLTMPHPSAVPVVGVDPGGESGRRRAMQGLATAEARLFYAQANSFVAFLAERGGPRFIGVLALELAKGTPLKTVLGQTTLPTDVSALEISWREWARQHK